MEPQTPNSPQSEPQPAPSVTNTPNEGGGGKKTLLTIVIILAVLSLLGGGAFAAYKTGLLKLKGFDCANYSLNIDSKGLVTVTNTSSKGAPAQKVKVLINSSEIASLDAPALEGGESAAIGTVATPEGQFEWQLVGASSCTSSGTVTPSPTPIAKVVARCELINAYDEEWNLLTAADLSALKKGDVVRFTVLGTSSEGIFDKARFTINDEERPETTSKRPSSDEFYEEYIVPTGINSISVSAKVHHGELDKWF